LVKDNLHHARLVEDTTEDVPDVEFEHVRTGADAVAAVRRGSHDAVALDYRLPDWNGVKLCRPLRDERFEGTILITSSARRDALGDEALEAGANDYLTKSTGFGRRLVDGIRAGPEADA
jgi:DNA-binding response OmpR family regulator